MLIWHWLRTNGRKKNERNYNSVGVYLAVSWKGSGNMWCLVCVCVCVSIRKDDNKNQFTVNKSFCCGLFVSLFLLMKIFDLLNFDFFGEETREKDATASASMIWCYQVLPSGLDDELKLSQTLLICGASQYPNPDTRKRNDHDHRSTTRLETFLNVVGNNNNNKQPAAVLIEDTSLSPLHLSSNY